MYLSENAYAIQPDTIEQMIIYGYIRELASQPCHSAIDAFYRLLWEGSAHPHGRVQKALRAAVEAHDFDQHKLKFVNRCYHTLVNPWHLSSGKDYAIEDLILWLDNLPARRGQSLVVRKLRDALRAYKDDECYTILRKHLRLLNEDSPSDSAENSQQFGDSFPEYFFIYEAGTRTPDIENAASGLNEGVIHKQNQRLRQFHQELSQFYVRHRRSGHASSANPTNLSDADLARAIDLYRPKREQSFRRQADAFKRTIHPVKSMREFKRLAHDHAMQPVLQLGSANKRWMDNAFQRTLENVRDDVPVTQISKITLFRKLINRLVRDEGDRLFRVICETGPNVVISTLLNIVLACEMARFELEKRFAQLHDRFARDEKSAVNWLVSAFDHMNVALALNAKSLGYLDLHTLRTAGGMDSV